MSVEAFTPTLPRPQAPERTPVLFRNLADILRAGRRGNKADQQKHKAWVSIWHVLQQHQESANEFDEALLAWAKIHLAGANAEIQALVGGAFAMIERRQALFQAMCDQYDKVDATFAEQDKRIDMVDLLIELNAEQEE